MWLSLETSPKARRGLGSRQALTFSMRSLDAGERGVTKAPLVLQRSTSGFLPLGGLLTEPSMQSGELGSASSC